MTQAGNCQGYISQIQDFCVHDGDGIRSTIFFSGCPLRCKWCANPETWMSEDGRLRTVDDIIAHCQRQRIFYSHSGGGVTLSGGEPGLQPEFTVLLTRQLKASGFKVAMETSGYFSWPAMHDCLSELDLLFFDLKYMDSAQHQILTGKDNGIILENFTKVARSVEKLIVRFPLIPTINDQTENLRATAEFIRRHMPSPQLEILPYHNWSRQKYDAMNLEFNKYDIPSETTLLRATTIFQDNGVQVVDFK